MIPPITYPCVFKCIFDLEYSILLTFIIGYLWSFIYVQEYTEFSLYIYYLGWFFWQCLLLSPRLDRIQSRFILFDTSTEEEPQKSGKTLKVYPREKPICTTSTFSKPSITKSSLTKSTITESTITKSTITKSTITKSTITESFWRCRLTFDIGLERNSNLIILWFFAVKITIMTKSRESLGEEGSWGIFFGVV